MPGFRKGKLPDRVVEQRFGPSIDQETLDRTIQDAFREAVQSQGLAPITQGKIENIQYERGADLSFDVEFGRPARHRGRDAQRLHRFAP